MGQTLERMKNGYSKIRNEALARAFSYMNLIEYWGSGIPRIIGEVKAARLREPEFIGGEVDLRINLYRDQNDLSDLNNSLKVPDNANEMPDTTSKVPDNANEMPDTTSKVPDNDQESQIYKYVVENGSITTAKAAGLLEVKERRARAILRNMIEENYLTKEGAARSTIYVKNTESK